MLKEWRTFKGWVVMEYFMNNPSKEIHVRGLAKELGVSPLTSNTYLRAYAAEGLLKKKRSANAIIYSLANDSPVVKRLKQFYTVAWLTEKGFVDAVLKDNPQTTGIVLYGTHASGEYDERSDFDIIVFSMNPQYPKRAVESLGKEATLNILTVAGWKKKNKEFKNSALRNNIVLYGAGLPM